MKLAGSVTSTDLDQTGSPFSLSQPHFFQVVPICNQESWPRWTWLHWTRGTFCQLWRSACCCCWLLLEPVSLSWLVGFGIGRWYLVNPGVSQHGIDQFRSRAVRTTLPCGCTSPPPCHVSTDALSWGKRSCLVRACEGGTLVVRAPGLTVDASENRGPLLPPPIPVTHRDNRHPAAGGGGYPLPHSKQAGLSWVLESCK